MNNHEINCIGCGVIIQTENLDEIGYTPASALSKEEIICQRCFRLKHYNEVQDVSLTDQDFLKFLNELGKTDSLIVKMIDIFDFNGSWFPGLHRFVGNNPILLVGNKVDLLPKSTNRNKIIQWMKGQAKEFGLKPIDISLSAQQKDYKFKKHWNKLNVIVKEKTCMSWVVQMWESRHLLIESLKNVAGGEDVITTSHFPGTTLDID